MTVADLLRAASQQTVIASLLCGAVLVAPSCTREAGDADEAVSSPGNVGRAVTFIRRGGDRERAGATLEFRIMHALEEAQDANAAPAVRAEILVDLASVYEHQGRATDAATRLEQAASLWHAAGDEHRAELAKTLTMLARAQQRAGRTTAAAGTFAAAIEATERAFGAAHENVAVPVAGLATLHFERGELVEAERLYERALRLETAAAGAADPRLIATLHNLALVRRRLGRQSEARELLERALGIARNSLGPDHPTTRALGSQLGAASK